MGKSVVIKGLDENVKAIQSDLFNKYLLYNISAVKVSFSNYNCESSSSVKMYLQGKFGTDPSKINAYVASQLNWGVHDI